MRRAAALALVAAFAVGTAATVSPSTAVSPRCGPYGNLPREDAPVASGDGRVVAWARWGWREPWSRVFVSAPDGSNASLVSVPDGARDDTPLALSPDGGEILIGRRSGALLRYILARDSAAARFVSEQEARELQRRWRTPEWSPDGRYRVEAEDDAVWVVSAEGGERRRVASFGLPIQGAAWSPEGTLIAIGTEMEGLHVVKPDGTELRRVAGTPLAAQSPFWSPDGSWLAFESDGSSSKSGSWISVIRPDGSGLRALTHRHEGPDEREAGSPSWVDDDTVIFTSYQRRHDGPHKIYDIHTIGVDGRGERRVTYQCHLGTTKDDLLRGSILADTMRTYAGDDEVRPGPGVDEVDAGAGNDLVRSSDATRDRIRCGRGRDRVVADRRDLVRRDCERVSRR